jgi:tellurite resistance protein TehA-like permease
MKSLLSGSNEVMLECYDIILAINSITPFLILICFLCGFFIFSKKRATKNNMNKFTSQNKINYSINDLKDELHFFS